jgi:hypothetical protein
VTVNHKVSLLGQPKVLLLQLIAQSTASHDYVAIGCGDLMTHLLLSEHMTVRNRIHLFTTLGQSVKVQ